MTENESVGDLDTPRPAGNQVHRADGQVPLKLVEELCSALNAEGINYCHWKSNNAFWIFRHRGQRPRPAHRRS